VKLSSGSHALRGNPYLPFILHSYCMHYHAECGNEETVPRNEATIARLYFAYNLNHYSFETVHFALFVSYITVLLVGEISVANLNLNNS